MIDTHPVAIEGFPIGGASGVSSIRGKRSVMTVALDVRLHGDPGVREVDTLRLPFPVKVVA